MPPSPSSIYQQEPLISPELAHILAYSFSLCYVGSIYISKNARLSFRYSQERKPSVERGRDDPGVIKIRLLAVSIATIACCFGVFGAIYGLLGEKGVNNNVDALNITLRHLGLTLPWQQSSFPLFFKPYLIAPALFLGPLYARFLFGTLPFQRAFHGVSTLKTWQGIRNYVVAPITEEVVFRSCIIAVYSLSRMSNMRIVLLSPLAFGLAHIHHAWEIYNQYGRTSRALKVAAISSAFQFTYTTIFGCFCAYLFLRTGTILPAIFSHIFCNIMGVPELNYQLRAFPHRKWPIILTYITGVIIFCRVIVPWTEVHHALQ